MDPTGLRIVAPAGESVLSPDREHVVGRGRDCDVVIADGRVSRRHLRLEPSDDSWLARDISSNGIWVDGTRRVSVPLTGSEVRVHLGAANGPLVVLIPPPPPRPAAPPAAPDVADQETVLAGEGTRQPARSLLPHQIGPPPEAPAAGHLLPTQAGPVDGTARQAGRRPLAGWLHALPTLVWLAAAGFALGALLALT
ncbi:FHA domain-containing protein [Candidatus Frankia alpina]|uniref:FHA domain-containing protein n=1 Tax=Candidatus Frankia alpina TaxID=2699483 RepID=UPI0013D18945|nr:FHA domain-containing protein [Candidatus Frankia alpina]